MATQEVCAPPPGFHWVFCKCFKHWRTGELVYRKDGGFFRFLAKG